MAVKDTSPPSPHVKETGILFPHPSIRWEPLQVDIWKGGLENVNPEFVGIDCIVSSEVCVSQQSKRALANVRDRIEHLPEDILSKFAPVLLGAYHPRLFLVTTPSYTFNARFSPPELGSTEKIRQGGYLDPTGRTDRVFRHSDHKFEWTVEEFTEWCTEAAQEWGYTVQVKGIGKAIEVDEWGRDDELGFASQVALFTRVYGEEASKLRETAVPRALGTVGVCEHELLATHYHTPHACAGKPLKTKEIQEKVKAEMKRCDDSNLTIRELWNQDEIAIACGGQLDALLDAVRGSSELDLYVTQEDWQEEWRVELVGGVQGEKDLWSENAETEPLQSGPEVRFDDGWGFAEADKIWEPSVVSWGAASEVDPGWGWGSGAETGWGMTAEVVET